MSALGNLRLGCFRAISSYLASLEVLVRLWRKVTLLFRRQVQSRPIHQLHAELGLYKADFQQREI